MMARKISEYEKLTPYSIHYVDDTENSNTFETSLS